MDVRERLRAVWVDALDLDGDWSEEATFVELGGYSLLALSLAARIGAALDRDVPRTLVLEHPTFTAVARWLEQAAPAPARPADPPPPAAEPGEPFPMSPLQQAYLLGETGGFELGRAAVFVEDYHVADLDPIRLADGVDTLLRRHEMLRAAFLDDGGQCVLPPPDAPPVEHRDLRATPADAVQEVLRASRAELAEHVPPPASGEVLRFRVFRLAEGHRVQVAGRLLVFDGASGDILADELRTLLAGGELPHLSHTYREHRRTLAARRATEDHARDRDYWLRRLPGLPPAPDLPRAGPQGADPRGAAPAVVRRTLVLEPERWRAFRSRAAEHGVTVTVALCTAFCEVLRHYSADPDFTLTVLHAQREALHPDVPRVIGNFSDTLLLECRAAAGSTFAERAARLGDQLTADLAHPAFSGVDGIRELNSRRGAGRAPAMPVAFASVIGGARRDGVFLERLGWRRVDGAVHTPQVSLDHQVFDSSGTLVANWDAVDGVYPLGLVEAMVDGYRSVVHALCDDPAAWRRPSLVRTPRRQLEVRAALNDTARPVPPSTLHEPVLAAAGRTPDAVAVVAPDGTRTFAELAAAAVAVAGALGDAGCGPGDLVAVRVERGWRQVAALLGVLAAGAAYVPLGPRWPAARIESVVRRARPRVALVDRPTAGGMRCLAVGTALRGRGGRDLPAVDPESPAYVVFTSGTSGEPKGVVIRHRAAANTIADLLPRFAIGPRDRVLALSEVTFDLSVFDVFGLLAAGGAVVVPDADRARDVAELHVLCETAGVTVWNSVPALLGILVEYRESARRPDLPELRLAMASGDWVPVDLGDRLAATLPQTRLVSLGGATEASIWSNWFPVPRPVPPGWTSIPYGHPLTNQGFRVLDGSMADRPDWVPGDLYIAGAGLADGYLGDPELTAAAFPVHDGVRLYRTGDRARYWSDGTLEFLGRRDGQVKVNGMRVELGDVESALLAVRGVRAAVAVAVRDRRGGRLVAHVVLDAEPDASRPDILAALRDRLPDYLVPSAVVVHERLALTVNGKVDRAALAAYEPDRPAAAAPPAGPTERRLLELWRTLVPVRGVTEDFFACGGHSVTAAVLLNRVEKTFGTRLPLSALYRYRTVREQAAALDRPAPSDAVMHLAGAGDPLVLVHPVGGDVLCYRPLVAELAADFAVHGIAAEQEPEGDTGVPDLAARYHALVRDRFPGARVGLVGWSFGAAVAYEMARLAGGAWPVVLLDPWLPARPGAAVPEADLRAAFARDSSDGRPAARDAAARDAAGYARYSRHAAALARYVFTPDADVVATVVSAAGGLGVDGGTHLVPLAAGVDRTALPGAVWHAFDGDHFDVVDPARAVEVAGLVRQGVRR